MTEAAESADDSGHGPAGRRPGTPCWASLMARSVSAAQAFYGELFDWEFRPGPDRLRPYARAVLDGRDVAGIGRLPADLPLPVAWTPYLASADVDRTAETVRRCGGTIGVGPLETGGAGRLAIGSDPSGAVFGLWRAPAHRDTDAGGAPGTPVWHELHTFETASVAKFYTSLFGYEAERRDPQSGPPADHVTLSLEGRPVAALHGAGPDLPRDRGSYWLTYFAVTDADAALARLTALGGRALAPPHDTAHGRVATAADPEGARFALLATAR